MELTSGIVESTHESWSQLVESRSRRIPSYYVILKNGHFQNRLHDSTVKIEPASDSTLLCNREYHGGLNIEVGGPLDLIRSRALKFSCEIPSAPMIFFGWPSATLKFSCEIPSAPAAPKFPIFSCGKILPEPPYFAPLLKVAVKLTKDFSESHEKNYSSKCFNFST